MAGVAQLVELWIVIPMPLSNINDLTPKIGVDKCGHIEKVWTKCGQIKRRE